MSLREWKDWKKWIRSRIDEEQEWYHRFELAPDLITPGWDDVKNGKLPIYGLPDDMRGMRVLDIGCCEGFFSFEAERRGASEVIAVEANPGAVRRFHICKDALGSKITPYLASVYDLSPRRLGTFDVVFFFGVLYHLRDPLLALEKVLSVCTGTMLMETAVFKDPSVKHIPVARFYPSGATAGPGPAYDFNTRNPDVKYEDPTALWAPNVECVKGMLVSTGFQDVEVLRQGEEYVVCRAKSPTKSAGRPPEWWWWALPP
jgi:tRNA (mo5U34)-methyltransferase